MDVSISQVRIKKSDDLLWKVLIHLGRKRKIKFYEADLKNYCKGICFSYKSDTYIFIDKNIKDWGNKCYVLAHELGHAVLHHNANIHLYKNDKGYRNKIEQEADRFATKLIGLLERRMCIDGEHGINSSIEATSQKQ